MLDEIRQQPAALERTLTEELPRLGDLRRLLEPRPRLIVLAARGTSDNAAQFGRYLLEIATGIPVSLAAPSTYTLYQARLDLRDALVVAISQSGESTDVNVVLERAQQGGARTVGITNEGGSTLARLAQHALLVHAGRETSVAATKTYTGQLLAFYLLAHALGAPVSPDDLRHLPEYASAALQLEGEVRARAERYRFIEHAVVVGRGLNYANAFEFSLKLMETCYVVAERFSAADLLHGPIAMLESAFPVFVFTPPGVTWPPLGELLDTMRGLQADTMVITDQSNEAARERAHRALVVPARLAQEGALPVEVFTPIPYIIPAQLLAACLAEEKGLNPDQPRTLSKVTRTL